MAFNPTNTETLNLLLNRRSVKTKNMIEPGPNHDELTQILTAAARVPDHGKLAPWRFIVVDGDERAKLGNIIADAVWIVPAGNTVEVVSLERSLTSEDVTANVSVTVQVP